MNASKSPKTPAKTNEAAPKKIRIPPCVQRVLRWALEGAERYAARAREAEKDTLQHIYDSEWEVADGKINGAKLLKYLTSVPGVGTKTAITWLTQVGDPNRFEHPGQVAAFAGCDPSLKVSAGKVTEQTRRKGNRRLHYALNMAAGTLIAKPREPVGQWGAAIAGRHKKGGFMKARGAVARRIACALWWVHRKAEPFSYEKYNFVRRETVPTATIEEMGLARFAHILKAMGLDDSQKIIDSWLAGKLGAVPGVGLAAFQTIKAWYEQNKGKVTESKPQKEPHEQTQKERRAVYASVHKFLRTK